MLLTMMLLLVILVFFLYMWIMIHYSYWTKRNIPQAQISIFGGNIGKALILKKNMADIYAEIYRQYQGYPFVGIYKIFTPTLLVRDPELIKLIILKEFSNFYNNTIALDESDPIAGKNPFFLNGEKWKTVRNQLTPLFTTAKVKSAVAVFNNGGQKLVDYIERLKESDDLDGRDVVMRYAIENIASYTLGLEANSFGNDNSEFRKIALELFESSTIQSLIFYIAMVFPTLTQYLKIRLAASHTENRFKSIISHAINCRLENKIVRNDLLSTLISMKTAGTFSDHDISVVIGSFYIDGIETSSTVLNYLLYDLAAHPWTQEKLKAEINNVFGDNNTDTVSYEAIQDMKYLDAVFNESLRLHTPIPFMDKQTTKDTTLNGRTKDEKSIKVCLEVGTPVIIPLRGLHMDENYFPDPLAFKPERFLPENKDSIPKFAFLPFGEGPRICLGKIFGTLQVKVGVIHIIRNYKVTLGNNTSYCTDINPNAFILRPKNSIRLRFQRW